MTLKICLFHHWEHIPHKQARSASSYILLTGSMMQCGDISCSVCDALRDRLEEHVSLLCYIIFRFFIYELPCGPDQKVKQSCGQYMAPSIVFDPMMLSFIHSNLTAIVYCEYNHVNYHSKVVPTQAQKLFKVGKKRRHLKYHSVWIVFNSVFMFLYDLYSLTHTELTYCVDPKKHTHTFAQWVFVIWRYVELVSLPLPSVINLYTHSPTHSASLSPSPPLPLPPPSVLLSPTEQTDFHLKYLAFSCVHVTLL